MFHYLNSTLHPDWYHGARRTPPFFEGWYFKFVDPTRTHRYAVIPGIFKHHDPAQAHAFVQVLDGSTGESAYHTFPVDAFAAARDRFDVRIGPNRFRPDSIELDLPDETLPLAGSLRFGKATPWPVSLMSPGIMGWFGWIPFMECYHGVVSLDHAVEGTLHRRGQRLDFSGGRGYIEKDWGQSFPAAWVWTQTNHFRQPGVSLTASVALIPWIGHTFPGFIVGLWLDGTLHRFTTYTGAQIERLVIEDNTVDWVMRSGAYRLELRARRAGGGLLRGPSRTAMGQRVMETLLASVEVRLCGANGRVLFEDVGECAGLEVQGDLARLQSAY